MLHEMLSTTDSTPTMHYVIRKADDGLPPFVAYASPYPDGSDSRAASLRAAHARLVLNHDAAHEETWRRLMDMHAQDWPEAWS